MTYQVNMENTGLATDDQAAEVARILQSKGYDVVFTRNFGHVNSGESCPCTDAEWEAALIAAASAFPAT